MNKKVQKFTIFLLFTGCIYLLALLFHSCSTSENVEDHTMDFNKVKVIGKNQSSYNSPMNEWIINGGLAKTNITTLYKNKYPVIVTPDTTSTNVDLYYNLNTTKIELGEIEFSGMYKMQEPQNDILTIRITSLSAENKLLTDSINIFLAPQDTVWSSFRVLSTPHNENRFVSFVISYTGNNSFLINDCNVTILGKPLTQILNPDYGAEKDKEFDDGSTITIN